MVSRSTTTVYIFTFTHTLSLTHTHLAIKVSDERAWSTIYTCMKLQRTNCFTRCNAGNCLHVFSCLRKHRHDRILRSSLTLISSLGNFKKVINDIYLYYFCSNFNFIFLLYENASCHFSIKRICYNMLLVSDDATDRWLTTSFDTVYTVYLSRRRLIRFTVKQCKNYSNRLSHEKVKYLKVIGMKEIFSQQATIDVLY